MTAQLGPDGRMLLVLLNATDPFGVLDTDTHPHIYAGVAGEVLRALRAGSDVSEIIGLLVAGGYRVQQVAAFARAAFNWWTVDAPKRWAATVAAAA